MPTMFDRPSTTTSLPRTAPRNAAHCSSTWRRAWCGGDNPHIGGRGAGGWRGPESAPGHAHERMPPAARRHETALAALAVRS
eukprot:7295491-Prymnesium_polylepis.4